MIPACQSLFRELGELLLEQIAALDEKTRDLDKRLRDAAGRDGATKRLQTMPGVGPVTAVAVETFAAAHGSLSPEVGTLPPGSGSCRSTAVHRRQTAARENLQDGPAGYPQAPDHRRDVGRAGVRTLSPARRIPGIARMLGRKPRMLVALALANKMARGDLGDAHEGGELSGSGDDGSLIETITRVFRSGTPGGVRRSTDSKGNMIEGSRCEEIRA